MIGVFVFLGAALLVIISVRERMRLHYAQKWRLLATKESPLSRALAGLVGTAGGIYISVVMFLDFIGIKAPQKWHLGNVEFEPLAAFSFILAVIQPFCIRLFFHRWSPWSKSS